MGSRAGWIRLVVLLAFASACGSSSSGGSDATHGFADGGGDDGALAQGGNPSDASLPPDASSPAAGAPTDAGTGGDSSPSAGGSGDGAALADGGPATGAVSYTTNFDLTELPISENGAWTNVGLDWTFIGTSGGVAYGTQTGKGGYDDSYAHLSGFPPNQSASGIIHRDAMIDGSCTHEVEIHLHWSDAPHDAHGYECNLAFDGSYAQIVRWNGAKSDFTYLASGSVPGGVHDGDTLTASIVGDLITLSVNGVEITHATDATFTTGNPGMGLWRGSACGSRGDYGFTTYTAKSTGP